MSANYKLVLRECKRKRQVDLDFSHQDITIVPDELFTLTFLRKIDLSNNHISHLDNQLETLTNIEVLDLRNNLLTEFPFVLLSLPKLKTLYLTGNQFSDKFAFLNKVSENFEDWKQKIVTLFEKTAKSFREDFFSDEEKAQKQTLLPFLASKNSYSDEKNSQGSKNTQIRSEKDDTSILKETINKLIQEKAKLENILKDHHESKDLTDNLKRKLTNELQIKNIEEIKCREKISQGGFSIIEKAIFRGTTVVLKRFFDPTNSIETREEFLNEAKILNLIRHPNVVTLMGFNLPSNANDSFLVFEYVPNGNLYDTLHVKRTKFDKKRFLSKLAETMNFIHLSQICHRDLKSLNVLVDSSGHPKIIDFGLARPIDGLNKGSMKYAATPSYSAPELFLQKELTFKVDVYAFGILMWEILSEDVPFRSMAPIDIKKFVLAGEQLDIKSFSSSIGEIIKNCCAFEPEKRPTFAQIVEQINCTKF